MSVHDHDPEWYGLNKKRIVVPTKTQTTPKLPTKIDLISEVEKWSQKYELSFQFWGKDGNNAFIYKHDVELTSMGGFETVEEVLKSVLAWIYDKNKVPQNERLF